MFDYMSYKIQYVLKEALLVFLIIWVYATLSHWIDIVYMQFARYMIKK